MPTISTLRRRLVPLSLAVGLALLASVLAGCAPSELDLVADDAAAAAIESTPKSSVRPSPKPIVTVSKTTTSEPLPFAQVQSNDPNRTVGDNAITTVGAAGVRTSTWRVTLTNGVETGRTLLKQVVTIAPVDEVTSIGTFVPPPPPPPPPPPAPAPVASVGSGCDPNYSGQCVPVASDVDCGGGSGNGPAYVNGVVTVIGTDIYDLDRDGDGIGCD